MIEDKVAVFKQTELFRDLNEDVLRILARYASEKILNRNEILFLTGEAAAGLFVIASGALRAFRTGMDGHEQIIHVERAITTIGELPVFDGGKYPSTAAAEEDATKVYFLDKREVRAICLKHPEVALAATRLLAARLRTVREVITRVFYRLQNQGLIIVDGKEIFIPNLAVLAAYADSSKN